MHGARCFLVVALLATALPTPEVGAAGNSEQAGGSGGGAAFGVIEYLEGEVTVDGAVAAIGAEVASGQTVVTGPAGLAEIVFDDRNVFQLRENTTVVLDVGADEARSVELQAGAFAAVFDRLRQIAGEDAFVFRAPSTVGGVRGTTFYVRVEDERSTYVCTCNGATHLAGTEGDEELSVEADYHTAYRFVREGGAVRTESAPLLYHTDAEMDALAAKVGARIPWER